MKKKFLASALAASMVGTMFASMPAFAEEESSSAAAEEVTSASAEEESSSAAAEATYGRRFRIMMMSGQRSGQMLIHLSM